MSSTRKKSIVSLPIDCMYEIIQQLPEESQILYKFLFVNRFWFKSIVSLLWKYPFKKINEDSVKNARLIRTYLGCLDEEEKNNIEIDHHFKLPSIQKPFLNYAKYLTNFTIDELNSSVRDWYFDYRKSLLYKTVVNKDFEKAILSSIYHLFIRSNHSNLESLEFKQDCIHSWNWEKVLQDTIRLSSLRILTVELHEDLKDDGDNKISDLEFFNILLSRCTNLQTLKIYLTIHEVQEEYLKCFSANQIIKIIQAQKNLEILNISNFYKHGSELTKIISGLESQCNSLRELQFNDINFKGCSLIGLKFCSNLESIIFSSCCGLTKDHCNTLSQSSFKLKSLYFHDLIITHLNVIAKMLYLFGNSLTSFGTTILTNDIINTASIRCPNIKCLSIITRSDFYLQEIFSWICNLELIELDITSSDQEPSKFFQLLGYYLPNTLKILKLQCSYVSNNSLKNLFSSHMNLERLIFRNSYEFNYDCLMVIYEYIINCKNFKELTFKTYRKEWSLRDLKVLEEIKKHCPLVNCEFEISTVEEMLDGFVF
ncbi:hypothetical protein C1645_770858 [Glomus cerebriforme]|uniref:F-box domain-containing protein n=1 Tax=Glomus cerebriforme TaxID=658196 RepID=A0A397SYH0_9GLOM|nr:hypothetical protein C1645_770858 [Glomus cerebriforme]